MRSFSSWCVCVNLPYLTLRVLQCHRCKWEHCVVEAEMMYCAALAQRVTRWIWGGWSVLQALYTAISLPNLISFWMDMTAFQQTTFLRETFLTNICFVLAQDFKCFWLLIKYYSTAHWGGNASRHRWKQKKDSTNQINKRATLCLHCSRPSHDACIDLLVVLHLPKNFITDFTFSESWDRLGNEASDPVTSLIADELLFLLIVSFFLYYFGLKKKKKKNN